MGRIQTKMAGVGRTARLLSVLAIAAAVISACSSSSKAPSAASTSVGSTAGTSAHAPSGAPIKVGMICSCTGPFGSDIADAGNVTRAWAKSVNASGGIDGHPVQLTVYDDSGNPGTSTTDLQKLISANVDVILDETPLDAAWATDASSANIPVVGGNFSSEPFYTNPDFYPSGQTNDSIAYSVAATAKLAGATTIAQMYCAEAPQCQQSVPLIKSAAQKLGISDVYDASIAMTAPNYTAQCVAAEQAHAQALFIGDSPQAIARVGHDCTQQGYKPIYVTEGTGFGPPQQNAPGLKDNLWQPFPVIPYFVDSAPGVKAMNAVLNKYYPGMINGSNWSEYAVQAWTGGLLIEAGVKAGVGSSGTPSPAAITKGLTSLKGETLGGMSPPLTLPAGKPHPIDCWYTGRVHNGTTSLANNGKLSCQSSSGS